MKIALITSDNREAWGEYHHEFPIFGTAPEALLKGFEYLFDHVEIHVICCTRKSVKSPQKLAANIFYHNIRIPSWGMMRSLYVKAIYDIRRKLREIDPDIVHGQGTEREAALAAVFSGYPNVLTIHGNMRAIARLRYARPFSFYWLTARMERLALSRTDGVICISKYTWESVNALCSKTWILPNAVDDRYFNVIRANEVEVPIFLCVGTICEYKNQNRLIEVLDKFGGSKSFKIRFLGNIEDRLTYGQTFLDLVKNRPWCVHVGFVSREELEWELSNASALILPSIEDNCPMVVLEAMAAGVPILASRVGGVPDLIEHKKTGLLFEPNDIASMEVVIREFLEQRNSMQTMATEAKKLAWQRFHPRRIAQKHLEIYQEILSK